VYIHSRFVKQKEKGAIPVMEKQIMPEVKIVDIKALRERAGAFLSGVWNAGRSVELCLSEHNSGASVMLDQALDNQPQLPFEDGGRWDDQGRY
jgi:hypothetical protein